MKRLTRLKVDLRHHALHGRSTTDTELAIATTRLTTASSDLPAARDGDDCGSAHGTVTEQTNAAIRIVAADVLTPLVGHDAISAASGMLCLRNNPR